MVNSLCICFGLILFTLCIFVNLQGDLVYVNYGTVEDFMYVTTNLSFNLTGTIVIARYGKIFRGDKVSIHHTVL